MDTNATNQGGVAEALAATTLDPKRPATQQDVAMLMQTYQRLASATKRHKDAVSSLQKGLAVWTEGADYSDLQLEVEEAAANLTSELVECRAIIASLPNGVTGRGGKATRQTIVLEFYGAVNRDLNARITASEAKAINKAAFGR